MSADQPTTIAEPLLTLLKNAGDAIAAGEVPGDLGACIDGLGALPPEAAGLVEAEVASLLGLFGRHAPVRAVNPWTAWLLPPRQRDDIVLLSAQPALAALFLFHRDGYVREAALARLDAALDGPFWVAALARRLNDWVPQVRAAAATAARRAFAKTDPAVLAAAARFLIGRRNAWRRWGAEAAVLDEALGREDVADALAALFEAPGAGAKTAMLRDALRGAAMDRHLLRLARCASLPAVRAEAMRTLLRGRARWPVGYRRTWIDKSHGLWRRTLTFQERPVTRPVALATLAGLAARDRSPQVRRLAAEAAVRHGDALPNLEEVTGLLRADRSRAVREAIAFVDRRRAGPA
ncbi:MAG: hypothetical protein JO013_08385 [Alphaproteobacteria bacterium]|nr:hypothetical protein [Alphaproteobacteria bacterium]